MRDRGAIEGRDYGTLVPLVETLERKGLWTGATVVYGALLIAILDRAYASAYHHAARYRARLAALAPNCTVLRHLESPEMFEARIRAQHKHESSFWAHVSGARRADDDPSEDADDKVDSSGCQRRRGEVGARAIAQSGPWTWSRLL